MNTNFGKHLSIRNDFALFNNIKNVNAKQASKSLRSITERLSTPIETPNKDTYLIGPYKLGPSDKRSNQNVESVSALVFDIDDSNGYTFEDVVALTSDYFGILHTTWSHTAQKPRYRLVIHLKTEIPAREFSKIRNAFLFFNPELATIVDPACSDISRAYYWFSFPPEQAENAQCCVLMGNPIDNKAARNLIRCYNDRLKKQKSSFACRRLNCKGANQKRDISGCN
jgi:hypothetical protein